MYLAHGLDASEETHEAGEPGDAETDDERPLRVAEHVDTATLLQQVAPAVKATQPAGVVHMYTSTSCCDVHKNTY